MVKKIKTNFYVINTQIDFLKIQIFSNIKSIFIYNINWFINFAIFISYITTKKK